MISAANYYYFDNNSRIKIRIIRAFPRYVYEIHLFKFSKLWRKHTTDRYDIRECISDENTCTNPTVRQNFKEAKPCQACSPGISLPNPYENNHLIPNPSLGPG